MTYKTYQHNPPHLFLDDSYYFLTAATYKRIKYFSKPEQKDLLLNIILEVFGKYGWIVDSLVVLMNHYHVIAKSKIGGDLSYIFRDIHRTSSNYLKKQSVKKGLRVWWNYWDKIIRNQEQYDIYSYYLWNNPVHHGYITDSKMYKWLMPSNNLKQEDDFVGNLWDNKLISGIRDDF